MAQKPRLGRRELRIAKAEAAFSKLAAAETTHDGWYLLHTNLPIARAGAAQAQGHYKNLLEVEETFCELKSYLQTGPVFHQKSEGLINHARI